MAKKSQCEQCDRYNQESGLCRKNWNLIEFDDTECEFFGKGEPAKVEVLEYELGAEPKDETIPKSEPSPDQYADLRQRHGCATTWIFLMFSVHLFLIFFRLYNIIFQDLAEEQITENISGIIVSLIIIVAVFLLFKWKIWDLCFQKFVPDIINWNYLARNVYRPYIFLRKYKTTTTMKRIFVTSPKC